MGRGVGVSMGGGGAESGSAGGGGGRPSTNCLRKEKDVASSPSRGTCSPRQYCCDYAARNARLFGGHHLQAADHFSRSSEHILIVRDETHIP